MNKQVGLIFRTIFGVLLFATLITTLVLQQNSYSTLISTQAEEIELLKTINRELVEESKKHTALYHSKGRSENATSSNTPQKEGSGKPNMTWQERYNMYQED